MATYYISPTGSDANSGLSTSAPWGTWAKFASLVAGDTLMVMDGTYTVAANGRFLVDSTSCQSGTAANRITVQAVNERQALILGNGAAATIEFTGTMSYWSVVGLYHRQVDNSANLINGDNLIIRTNCHHITLRRLLGYGNNRYANCHCVAIVGADDCLVEECEAYFYHRHGFTILSGGLRNTFRRCYANARGARQITGGYTSNNITEAFVLGYHGTDNFAENCIAEGSSGVNTNGFVAHAQNTTVNNRYYGCIALNASFGFGIDARGNTLATMPQDTLIEHCLEIGATSFGIWLSSTKDTVLRNVTMIGGARRLDAFLNATSQGDGAPSVTATNCLAIDSSGIGFRSSSQASWTFDHCNSFNNAGGNYSPAQPNANITNSTSIDEGITTIRPWLPDTSPMKGAGIGGTWPSGATAADIGAEIIYRYEGGALTGTRLWDAATGQFPIGATVSGVNDVAGVSAYDVHLRLNVPATPFLVVSPTTLTYALTVGETDAQTVTVTNTGVAQPMPWSVVDNQTWVSSSPTSDTDVGSFDVTVDATSLATGTHNATVTVSAPSAVNSPILIPLTATISAAAIPETPDMGPGHRGVMKINRRSWLRG